MREGQTREEGIGASFQIQTDKDNIFVKLNGLRNLFPLCQVFLDECERLCISSLWKVLPVWIEIEVKVTIRRIRFVLIVVLENIDIPVMPHFLGRLRESPRFIDASV